jgi:hypothetical protein
MSRTDRRRAFFGTATISSWILMAFFPAVAGQAIIYDTTRILSYEGNECTGVASCQSVQTPKVTIGPGQTLGIKRSCPLTLPFVIGWDTEQHEHIQIALAPKRRPEPPFGRFFLRKPPQKEISLLASNDADTVGDVTIFLGCSATPQKSAVSIEGRGGVASKAIQSGVP